MKLICKICGDSVTPKTGQQCLGECKLWSHYQCLGYSQLKISEIKSGLVKISCPCLHCNSNDCNEKDPKETYDKGGLTDSQSSTEPKKTNPIPIEFIVYTVTQKQCVGQENAESNTDTQKNVENQRERTPNPCTRSSSPAHQQNCSSRENSVQSEANQPSTTQKTPNPNSYPYRQYQQVPVQYYFTPPSNDEFSESISSSPMYPHTCPGSFNFPQPISGYEVSQYQLPYSPLDEQIFSANGQFTPSTVQALRRYNQMNIADNTKVFNLPQLDYFYPKPFPLQPHTVNKLQDFCPKPKTYPPAPPLPKSSKHRKSNNLMNLGDETQYEYFDLDPPCSESHSPRRDLNNNRQTHDCIQLSDSEGREILLSVMEQVCTTMEEFSRKIRELMTRIN